MGGPIVVIAGASAAAAGFGAWAARGRSSTVFGPSVHRGPRDRKAIALTFDDGPSPSTPRLLDVLARFAIPATFFVCGVHVRRLGAVLRETSSAGHEIGNHTDTHMALWLRGTASIRREVQRAQDSVAQTIGIQPSLFRAPYGVRWFGLRQVQREMGLLGVMWTTIGRDWILDADAISARLWTGRENGAIFCLHDGRELAEAPEISNTIRGVQQIVPRLLDDGYAFCTVSDLLGRRASTVPASSPS